MQHLKERGWKHTSNVLLEVVCRLSGPGLQWTGEDQIVSVRKEETDMIRMAVR